MANHKSAEKRNRQRIARTRRAGALDSRVRHAVARARVAISEGAEDAASLVKFAHSLLDRAVVKNTVPRKRADRIKSRLATALSRPGDG